MPKIVRSTDELITNNITGALLPASGTTGERPSTPVDGQIRYNTTTPGLEAFVNGAWSTLAAGSGIGSFVRRDGDTMAGTLTFLDGNQLIVDEIGTVTAPAIAFDGDLDTGIYQSAGNIVGIAGQGANVALFDGSVATPVNHFTFASSATANAPIISNAGADGSGVGLGITIIAKTATASGAGGDLTFTSGTGNTTGAGGAITITSGGGGNTSGVSGAITISPTGAIASNTAGAAISITAGAATGSATGGQLSLIAGASTVSTGTGGTVTITGGASADNATGGPVTITGGVGGDGGTGGPLTLSAGNSGGFGDAVGGLAILQGGTGFDGFDGGAVDVLGGTGGTTGTGGAITITAGDSAGAGGTAGSVLINTGAASGGVEGTITIGQTLFPRVSTAIGILVLSAANTLTALDVTTGGATLQFLQFNDTGDTFTWENLETTVKGFSTITDDATTTITAEFQDDLLLVGAANGGITTVATEEPEQVTFSITPTDLATTGATIASADFMIVSDSADAATVIGQKVTFAAAFDDIGTPYTGGTLDLADYLALAGGTVAGATTFTLALITGANNGSTNTGVTAVEHGDGYNHVTVLTVSQVDALTLGDNVALADGYLLYTFPTGVCIIESTHMSMALTAGSAQLTGDTPDVGLGTTIASGAFASLDLVAGTPEDIITGQTADDSNGTEEDITLLPSAGGPFIIEDGETRTLHFNVANTWSDDTTPDLTANISGTVTIHWTFLGA